MGDEQILKQIEEYKIEIESRESELKQGTKNLKYLEEKKKLINHILNNPFVLKNGFKSTRYRKIKRILSIILILVIITNLSLFPILSFAYNNIQPLLIGLISCGLSSLIYINVDSKIESLNDYFRVYGNEIHDKDFIENDYTSIKEDIDKLKNELLNSKSNILTLDNAIASLQLHYKSKSHHSNNQQTSVNQAYEDNKMYVKKYPH